MKAEDITVVVMWTDEDGKQWHRVCEYEKGALDLNLEAGLKLDWYKKENTAYEDSKLTDQRKLSLTVVSNCDEVEDFLTEANLTPEEYKKAFAKWTREQ